MKVWMIFLMLFVSSRLCGMETAAPQTPTAQNLAQAVEAGNLEKVNKI